MGYVTPGSLGTLSAHLIKPPQTEKGRTPKCDIPGEGERGGAGLCAGQFGFA